jgi:hypothetical protein
VSKVKAKKKTEYKRQNKSRNDGKTVYSKMVGKQAGQTG